MKPRVCGGQTLILSFLSSRVSNDGHLLQQANGEQAAIALVTLKRVLGFRKQSFVKCHRFLLFFQLNLEW